MAQDQIRIFQVGVSLIDESGKIDANTLADDLTKKVQEIGGTKVQQISVHLTVETAGQSVNRRLKSLETVSEGSQSTLRVTDVPEQDQTRKLPKF